MPCLGLTAGKVGLCLVSKIDRYQQNGEGLRELLQGCEFCGLKVGVL